MIHQNPAHQPRAEAVKMFSVLKTETALAQELKK
jgi:hypothetical protein